MNLRPLVFVVLASSLLSGCIINVNGAGMRSFDYHHQEQLAIDANELTTLVANTGAGSLIIKGEPGLTQVQLEADIYGYEGIEPELTLSRDGDRAKLVANFDGMWSFSGNSPYIDLIVKVPEAMKLDIDDGSGSIDIKGVIADMKINDGSGSMTIDGGKSLDINDGSGEVVLTNVNGAINLEDGSGSIEISHVNGDVMITDGSGAMTIKHVVGKVTIDDGSGSIRVENSNGLLITESGSGDVSFDNINGPVSLN
ncbi:DUF4097 domain-containing protein [Shewanella sp. Isolate11]|uniref:DUF4097 domain-containing protein n=1 Tax=Shewanella sp. Isolate11 TaxID=2908530 RepID=UPI001EFE2F99|nr:DUF4097 domain-containing protein [Shewanella sp. Isolate11]MCG9698099.1 DUF4097 domain-containing protein [Shewanella sp. Isolate11]